MLLIFPQILLSHSVTFFKFKVLAALLSLSLDTLKFKFLSLSDFAKSLHPTGHLHLLYRTRPTMPMFPFWFGTNVIAQCKLQCFQSYGPRFTQKVTLPNALQLALKHLSAQDKCKKQKLGKVRAAGNRVITINPNKLLSLVVSRKHVSKLCI